jgi:sirohydrochlorin ferrochelatase
MRRALLIVDHGSRSEEANAQLREVARLVEQELAARGDVETVVAVAHLEIGTPSIPEAIETLAARGIDEIFVHPYFLAPGRHVRIDVPREAQRAAASHPGLRIRVSQALGPHVLLAKLVVHRAFGESGGMEE